MAAGFGFHLVLMEPVRYQSFTIFPGSNQLQDSGEWTLEVRIMRRMEICFFSTRNTFASEELALEEALRFGKRIVDGELPGLSVDGLG